MEDCMTFHHILHDNLHNLDDYSKLVSELSRLSPQLKHARRSQHVGGFQRHSAPWQHRSLSREPRMRSHKTEFHLLKLAISGWSGGATAPGNLIYPSYIQPDPQCLEPDDAHWRCVRATCLDHLARRTGVMEPWLLTGRGHLSWKKRQPRDENHCVNVTVWLVAVNRSELE